MRRIYESDALSRDDEDPFSPRRRDADYEPQSFRSIDASAWSDRLVPHGLRCRSVSVRVSTPRDEFEPGEQIPFSVTMKNRLPIPVTIRTVSPLLWTWRVDGHEEASRVRLRDPPDDAGTLHFSRSERKRFRKRWSGKFRVSGREWRPADPGEHTIGAAINVDDPTATDLSDETTVRIVP